MQQIAVAWLALKDAVWQACGLRCTVAMFRRQEQAITRDWEIYNAGYFSGKRTDETMSDLFLRKTTPCGRFTVAITSNVPDKEVGFVQDHARSLKNLADLLTEGATFAMEAAVLLLESHQPAAPQSSDKGK